MDARSGRRGLTNGLGSDRVPSPEPGRVNGVRGTTNGLVNGTRGRTNGLVNGTRGRTNGLVNGTRGHTNGLVNGTGAVNGSGFVNGLPLRRNPFGLVTHRDLRRSGALLAVSVAVMLVLGYLLSTPSEAEAFVVDGEFTEWGRVAGHTHEPGNLTVTKVHAVGDQTFLYAETDETWFAGPESASVYVLVAVEGRDGYAAAPGFAAAFVAEAYGWDGALRGTVLREWTGASADADNASALVSRGAFPAASVDSSIEIALDNAALGIDASAQLWFRFATRAGDDADLGPIMGRVPGGLLVREEQNPLVPVVANGSAPLRLTFTALAADVRIRGVTLDVPPGTTYDTADFPRTIAAGGSWSATVPVSIGSLPSGTLYTARVRTVDATLGDTSTRVRATVVGDGARAYVGAAPPGHAVDGLFDDWPAWTDDPADGVPPSVDIRRSNASLGPGAFFYVRTAGDAMAGVLLPIRPARPEPGNGSVPPARPVPVPRVAGEDVLRVYLDTDDRDAAGIPFGGLIADRLVEVRGRLGRITATALYVWDAAAGAWESRAERLDLAFVGAELEGFAPPAFLGTPNNAAAAFAMSDWSGAHDETDVHALRGTRGGFGLRPFHGLNGLTIVATALTNVPVVDANCASTGGEYAGGSQDSNADLTFYVGRRDDTQYVFVCVEADADGSDNGASDWGELLFDRNHDGVDPPQDGDRRFRVASAPAALTKEKGDGLGGWTACGADCDAGDIGAGEYTNGIEVYEFRIRYSDVWGDNNPTGNPQAGFAIVAFDFGTGQLLVWGSDTVDEDTPSTWGHLEIPEFPAFAAVAPLVLLGLLGGRARRRRPAANP